MAHSQRVRDEVFRLLCEEGLSACAVTACTGVPLSTVCRWVHHAGMTFAGGPQGRLTRVVRAQAGQEEFVDSHGRLSAAGRVVIQLRLREGCSLARIARDIGVHRSTIGREINRNHSGGRYHARIAHTRSVQRRARPRAHKIDEPELRAAIVERLARRLSPQQISYELRESFPGRDDMQVSHETIYQALYVQGKGALRHELTVEKALRTGRVRRRPRSKLPARTNRSWIGDAHISARPAEVADRAVPGHWEGDLIIGSGGQTALITVVERRTRFVMIRRLPLSHDASSVSCALIEMMGGFPSALRRSLTWDQGVEMAEHTRFSVATDCAVYFCDPHSPWQRGSNENTNGLIRDFFPKGTDFAQVSDEQVADVAFLLNTRPRQTLGWARPGVLLNEVLAVAPTT